ncbi:Signal transduction histidine kinase [Kytococcus aerolatus]|uniref:Oxygen sensor histidine kinase NreB n=1 Tax=Kytococcus aerolatus TaxID=592308 RepID=A0A212U5N5_9MICO|nr:histidine kinase [Kytococcus aerolatus]SNC73568.1 Signal transduction histidine kinase [Kytococcus aerolatus]
MERLARALPHLLLPTLLGLGAWLAHAAGELSPAAVALLAATVLLHLAGLARPRWRAATPLDPTPAAAVWLGAVSLAWSGLVLLTPAFVWAAFPLFVLWCVHCPMPVAGPALALTTLVAVARDLLAPGGGWGGVLGPVLVAAACGVAAWTMTRARQESEARARLVEELVATREELAAAHAAAGALGERQRIARDLHDTVVQSFTSVLLLARSTQEGGGPSAAQGALPRIEEVAAAGLADSRRVVEALRREAERTLPVALARVAAAVASPPTAFTVRGTERELPTAVEVALLRIAQGALGNVTEHARATRAELVLEFLADRVRLEVRDDGVGGARALPATTGSGRGTGLVGARERAEELGGWCTLDSPPGRGTRLTVELPA